MASVGIRELKAHLAEYIRRAERGESITITARGKPVASLGPDAQRSTPRNKTRRERALEMADRGLLVWAGESPPIDHEPLGIVGFSLSETLIRMRDEDAEPLADSSSTRPRDRE